MPIHPTLGYGLYEEGWKTIPDFPDYEVNHFSQVRNIKTKKILKPAEQRVRLNKVMKLIYHLSLVTFFPHIIPLETVDHIIEQDRNNNHINNLQWMMRTDNSKKSTILQIRNSGPASSKSIQQWTLNNVWVADFESVLDAATCTLIGCGNISNCARNTKPSAGGYKWTFKYQSTYDDLTNEKWATSDQLKSMLKKIKQNRPLSDKTISIIRVSNMGRVLTGKGIKTKGSKELAHPKYRRYADTQIHRLVWAVWGDRSPGLINAPGTPDHGKQEYILHDDSQPLDEDGCVSNAIDHLRLGSNRENMLECHAIGTQSKNKKRKLEEINS